MISVPLSVGEVDFFLLLSKESLYVVKSKLLSFVFIFSPVRCLPCNLAHVFF